MNIEERLRSATDVMQRISNWDEKNFSWDKCYISSVFSFLAYDYLTEYEIENNPRVKIIPCEHFIKVLSTRKQSDYKPNTFPSISNFDNITSENTIIMDGDVLVTSVIKMQNVIFISMRGTANTEDLLIDLECLPVKMTPRKNEKRKYHSGFFTAVADSFDDIIISIDKLDPDGNLPIIVTGHSLGGAMAAIFYDLVNSEHPHYYWRFSFPSMYKRSINCYTFGMPRHRNKYSLLNGSTPHHIHNDFDPVPSIPPKIFIYTDSKQDRCIDELCDVVRPNSKGSVFFKFIGFMPQILSLKYHKMELYMNRMERKIKL